MYNYQLNPPQGNGRFTINDLAKFGLVVYLFWGALYAPFKWLTFSVGAGYLFYIPKVSLAIILFLGIIVTGKINKIFSLFIFFTFISIIYGYYNFRSIEQVLFGVYIFLPFLYGLFFGRKIIDGNFNRIALVLWMLIVFGVLLNKFITYPWAGMNVLIGDQEVYVGKTWKTYGVERVSGFTAASYSAATQLLPLGIYILSFYKRVNLKFLLVFAFTLVSLIFTTTKGAIFAFFFVSMLMIFYRGRNLFLSSFMLLLICLNILLPLAASYYFSGISYGGIRGGSWLFTSETIYERMIWMWPESWAFIVEKGSLLFGDGMGGIGTPLSYFYDSTLVFASADSLFIYAYGLFGIFSVIFYFVLWRKTKKIDWNSSKSIFCTTMIFSLFLFGLVGAPFERDFWMAFLGISFNLIFEREHEKRESSYI